MSSDVTANSRTVVHKGDGIVNVSALPDVCKTPTPAGPTPVPYPNVARDADLADGAKHVTIEGNPVALESSQLKRSSGDEAGTLGGVVSGKNRGKMTWGTSSPDVLVEGKGIIRFADMTHHNCNTYNVLKLHGGSKEQHIVNYGDDAECPICGKLAPNEHPILSDEGNCAAEMSRLFSKLEAQKEREKTQPQIKGVTLKDAFMVALLICDCGLVFSAASGRPKYPSCENFRKIAKNLGHETEKDGEPAPVWARLLSLKKVKFQGPLNPNSSDALTEHHKKQYDINEDKRKANLREKIRRNFQGEQQIGQCAGPRVIALAIQNGHNPAYMCERWFGRSKGTEQKFQIREFSYVAPGHRPHMLDHGGGRITRGKKTFHHEENVPSCDLCKKQVPALLCLDLVKCPRKVAG